MGKAADRLREERRKTLGDWAAFCVACGSVRRYIESREDAVPAVCPECGGEVRARCPACDARFASAFAVTCEDCGAALREAELFGVPIRKPKPRR
jgi:predicted RNA-binding Zn-ribbon protein involved in translation (DUF1610 family)